MLRNKRNIVRVDAIAHGLRRDRLRGIKAAQPISLFGEAELLREEISKLQLLYAGQELGKITISVGMAVHPRHGMTSDMLLRSADNALYSAKGTGCDRVVMAA